ncbi:ninjurin-1 isoform X3 [Halyomorpha halys]|uniref:ninjurin-1 isoform X3 n=1 Tax=Halyomorpha halys TaxID=286706 RepID=UPI0006D5010D|nr:ninjurin-1 isoform X3 [Halyomorpha halys]
MITNSAIAPEITTALQPRKPLDANRYATKKTIAQGMLDIALLTANASQLKYILQIGDKHEFYSLMLGLITTSIILQVIAAAVAIALARMDIENADQSKIIANLGHIVVSCSTISMFLDIVKLGFGFEDAVPVKEHNG